MKTAVCLLCFRPSQEWINFLATFRNYDVYICADDNSIDFCQSSIIQIPNAVCYSSGFRNLNFTLHKDITAWEKALYYFGLQDYDQVWFFEDDVFFHSEQTLLDVDSQYPSSDLLTNSGGINVEGKDTDWHWSKIKIETPPPFYCAMVCACRMSKAMLLSLKTYANKYKTLFFLEACFPTLCKQNGLMYDTPKELHTITYKKAFQSEDFNTTNLFHPVKDISLHSHLRTPGLLKKRNHKCPG